MFEREDHWLSEKNSAGLFVDGGSNNMGVDRQALLIVAWPLDFHLHRGVLGWQEGSQVFIQNEHHLHLSCTRRERNTERWGERESKRECENMAEKNRKQKKKEADVIWKGRYRENDKGGRRREREKKWGHNMVMAARVSGEWRGARGRQRERVSEG